MFVKKFVKIQVNLHVYFVETHRLPYSGIFGGVSAMTVKQFKTVNGFSNSFWGWGGEDDDMSNRSVKLKKLLNSST